MNRSSTIREQVGVWGLILGLWALLVFAFAGQLVFTNSLEWIPALRLSFRDWLPWALLAPAVAWLAARFPLERGKLVVSLPVHVIACMLAVLACQLISKQPGPPQGPPQGARGGPFPGEGPREQDLQAEGDRLPADAERPPFRGPPAGRRPPPRALFLDALVTHAKLNLPIYWVIVSIVHALTYYRRSQEREHKALELEARLADAKLHALRMQLHPHFLFNTLNAISTLVHKDARAADEMIANLSELLRATLDAEGQEITLREEIALLDRYLEIQQTRFGDRLRIEKDIDGAALGGLVPTLILQPLVENAIRHGIEPESGPGQISVRAERKENQLVLRVHNNGGMNRGTRRGLRALGWPTHRRG
jgi:hypothetical protein